MKKKKVTTIQECPTPEDILTMSQEVDKLIKQIKKDLKINKTE